MMDAMAAFCITVLFSVWIWSLKHEIAEMQKRLSPAAHASSEAMNIGSHAGRTVTSGTPTWTLD